MSTSPETPLARYLRILRPTTDLTLLVLRGHLLLEEQLQAALDSAVSDPLPLEDARLTFAQKLRLVQALVGSGLTGTPWPFLAALNSLRNRLSHNVEVASLEADVDALIRLCPAAAKAQVDPKDERSSRLAVAIAATGGRLDAVAALLPDLLAGKRTPGAT